MEPFEFIQLVTITRDGVGGHVNNFITVLFAYLIMTYFVGEKLNGFQVWGLSIIYSVYEFFPAIATFQELQMLRALMSQFYEIHPAEASIYIPQGQAYPIPFAVIAFTSWLLSVGFMIQQRGKRGPIANE